ncbi:MAG: hypothetical protein AABY90_07960 [Nitrospirota bacterium]
MSRRRIALLAGLLAVGAVPGTATPPLFQITVEGGSPYFLPTAATVTTGVPIKWDNPTASYHIVTSDGCVTEEPCLFDSGSVAPNGSDTLPGLPPGRDPYHCQLHPIMRDVLTVVDPAATPALRT